MRRTLGRGALIAAAAAGAVVGVAVSFAFSGPTTRADGASPPTAAGSAAPLVPATSEAPAAERQDDPEPERPRVLLAWTSGGLPPGVGSAASAIDGVEAHTVVQGDEADLVGSSDAAGRAVDVLEGGWRIPLDVIAVDPGSFAGFAAPDDAATLRALAPGDALLTETSAGLRRVGPGATIRLAAGEVTVAGVIGDRSGAGAELVVHRDDAERLGVGTDRYLLVAHQGDRDHVQQQLADGPLAGRTTRFRTPAETTWLRHGDAVVPQAHVKAAYGEFAYREGPGRSIEIAPEWTAEWIRTATVPILGEVTCHRAALDLLGAAMEDLAQANLAHLVDPASFAGCFAPRRIAADQPLSRHAWGIAVDLNVGGNPRGSFSTQDPRLVETMRQHGFTWGGTWLVPDPAHYELGS